MLILFGLSYVIVGDMEYWMGGGFDILLLLLFVLYYVIGDGGMFGCRFIFRYLFW